MTKSGNDVDAGSAIQEFSIEWLRLRTQMAVRQTNLLDAWTPAVSDEETDVPWCPRLPKAAVDQHVGKRMLQRRVQLGISQRELAAALGVTYQQAYKFECGLNRVSAGRLYAIAKLLEVPISWLFEGLPCHEHVEKLSEQEQMGIELARNFVMIEDVKQRNALIRLAEALVQAELSELRKGSAANCNEQLTDVIVRHISFGDG
jgi:transcriptional regulator with XRE-family HTH domain